MTSHLVGDDEGRERFFRERKRRLHSTHNNICTVYEIDEAEGQIFLATFRRKIRVPLGAGTVTNFAPSKNQQLTGASGREIG